MASIRQRFQERTTKRSDATPETGAEPRPIGWFNSGARRYVVGLNGDQLLLSGDVRSPRQARPIMDDVVATPPRTGNVVKTLQMSDVVELCVDRSNQRLTVSTSTEVVSMRGWSSRRSDAAAAEIIARTELEPSPVACNGRRFYLAPGEQPALADPRPEALLAVQTGQSTTIRSVPHLVGSILMMWLAINAVVERLQDESPVVSFVPAALLGVFAIRTALIRIVCGPDDVLIANWLRTSRVCWSELRSLATRDDPRDSPMLVFVGSKKVGARGSVCFTRSKAQKVVGTVCAYAEPWGVHNEVGADDLMSTGRPTTQTKAIFEAGGFLHGESGTHWWSRLSP